MTECDHEWVVEPESHQFVELADNAGTVLYVCEICANCGAFRGKATVMASDKDPEKYDYDVLTKLVIGTVLVLILVIFIIASITTYASNPAPEGAEYGKSIFGPVVSGSPDRPVQVPAALDSLEHQSAEDRGHLPASQQSGSLNQNSRPADR